MFHFMIHNPITGVSNQMVYYGIFQNTDFQVLKLHNWTELNTSLPHLHSRHIWTPSG